MTPDVPLDVQRHRVPVARLEGAAGDSRRRNADVCRGGRRDRPADGGAGRGPRLRHQPGGARRAVPPRGAGCRRPGWLPLGRRPQGGAARPGKARALRHRGRARADLPAPAVRRGNCQAPLDLAGDPLQSGPVPRPSRSLGRCCRPSSRAGAVCAWVPFLARRRSSRVGASPSASVRDGIDVRLTPAGRDVARAVLRRPGTERVVKVAASSPPRDAERTAGYLTVFERAVRDVATA